MASDAHHDDASDENTRPGTRGQHTGRRSDLRPDAIPADEARAALEARRELGPEYEHAIAESFVEHLDDALERRVADAVERRLDDTRATAQSQNERSGQALALAIVSMALSIPLIAIMAEEAGTGGAILILVMIMTVNVAFNFGGRRRR